MDDRHASPPPHTQYGLPTSSRPLLGLTILVVEDSRFASEAIRLMCMHSGARLRRADCIASARRHLKVYRPSAIIVDIGLPDGSGLDLIRELAVTKPRIGVILGLSADDRAPEKAAKAGADGCLLKPLDSLALFQREIVAHLPADRQPAFPRAVRDEPIRPDRRAYHEDITHIADLLDDQPESRILDYVAQFLRGVALSAQDTPLAEAAQAFVQSRRNGAPGDDLAVLAHLRALVHDRLHDRAVI
ncbi:response regulator receiver domain-containing protein [Roseovarius halotolerans]|uniref:Transcriptional regulatory protein CitB n=1 Tax=Roseovarius halotolerans TaxID=505353 RepID=A0A1X6ZIM1_9RHOB|nr:response regulator [Roseovarius halotolerans]RKT31035.1 response regulator receiver domain-containing protein [Roseovarius halotolerans]SLN52647.1 Transcriptional regulatory protein CitB [Roseovarius halotolerans]